MGTISRRSALALGAGVALGVAGCTSSSGHPSAAGSPSSRSATPAAPAPSPTLASPSSSPSPSPSASATLHLTAPWRPSPNDVQPEVKLRAVRLIEALGTWPVGGQGLAAARKRAADAGYDPALADQAGGLLVAAPEAAVQVLEAQYGGILSDSASVLVVCRQYTPGNDSGGTTVDVRLSAAQPQWDVTALHPATPGPAAASLTTAARAVLADVEAITLPPAAHADVLSGNVHDSALNGLLTLARSHRIMLSVVRSGHPLYVFGTTRPSDHPKGRAFDVWTIDGHPVIDPATPRALVESFMRAAAAAGSYNVGGPYLLSGSGNQFFSDDTHHDHVHVGFDY
ncbi:hypothetical protein [Streptacidiphilus jiangxiensis]|uniref:hypothetical protein n=1 Tax=Streptacidiphilus jiangxiensis TaxID=235985 RepID=UPI001F2D3167|nr:hypothetical protein [Streptacidiphilus jiangxiensis]